MIKIILKLGILFSKVSLIYFINISLDKLYNLFIQKENNKRNSALKKLLAIYSKYLNKKKRFYFIKYHLKVSKLSSYLCTCKCTCLYPLLNKDYDSISLYRDSSHKNLIIHNLTENNIIYNKNYNFSPNESSPNIINNNCYSNNREIEMLNKSTYSNQPNLNNSQYYINGKDIGNISSFKINNFNSSMYINNNSKSNPKDKKYIVKIKLSNNHSIPNIFNKNKYNNKKNTSILKYTNNISNNYRKNISPKLRYRHYSYKNLTVPYRMNNSQNVIKNNNYYNFKNYENSKEEIPAENIYDIRSRKLLEEENEKDYNTYSKLIDQEILDYLHQNNDVKENLIKEMRNKKISLKKLIPINNNNNKNRILNLKNMNNYSYINNNYNYYCNNNTNQNDYNIEYQNLNNSHNSYKNRYEIIKTEKNPYSNILKKKVRKIEINKNPLKINYTNENIKRENIADDITFINNNEENTKHLFSSRTSKNIFKSDYYNANYYDNSNGFISPRGYKIPKKSSVIFPVKNIKTNINIFDNINNNSNNNLYVDHYDTDRTDKTCSNNGSLNGSKSVKMYKNKKYKNKVNVKGKKLDKNIIQKSLNLFFCNENKSNSNEVKIHSITTINNKIIEQNNKNNNDKKQKLKIDKIPIGINNKKDNNNNRKINNNKILKITHIDEEFNKDKIEKKEINNKLRESDSLRFSVESMNDSKIMEMANKLIEEEEPNREEIKEILNTKKENNKN